MRRQHLRLLLLACVVALASVGCQTSRPGEPAAREDFQSTFGHLRSETSQASTTFQHFRAINGGTSAWTHLRGHGETWNALGLFSIFGPWDLVGLSDTIRHLQRP